ncbi:LysM peptidoglycan-binding domain-containing protein [Thiorhodococcus mannitoliphagus]|uniref:LysM peptidoglycan-binding domain-containing protein n=1 Tax=Thiorhodococcus mannitoliphagus TaxID=329406 RepID=A0A6P1DPK7_9GAMM|nr:LysM peptidoglycan-binding domain-containing protein [Thiorhodococcus mannitoliphagus]NEX20207.1 LysM peptidoglycan-binding domain-containing protein [Thiorhodococcus mannitoliphagus]
MSEVSLLRHLAFVLGALALPFIAGCAGQSQVTATDEGGYYGDYAGVISAREYGYVRPAGDVVFGSSSRAAGRAQGSNLWSRVQAGMQLNLQANPRIDSTVERFRRDPRFLEKVSQRASPYLPIIVAEIERRGFPMEIALLPHVESRYNPAATSPKSAGGMWQFMPYTAREMGLRLDSGYDERRDVVASTRAALNYLEMLNRRFNGDWELAMAAYNCGPGRVEAAQEANRRRGKPTDFWSLDLPTETENYVPKILATAKLVADSRRYGQRLPAIPDRPQMEMIRSSQPMDLVRVATATGVSVSELRRLNPNISMSAKGGPNISKLMVPAGRGSKISATSRKISVAPIGASTASGVAVRVNQRQKPLADSRLTEGRTQVVKNGETLASIALRHGLDLKTLAEWNGISSREPLLPGQSLSIPTRRGGPDLVTHRVRKGDSLSKVARRYGVSMADIRRWNQLTDKQLRTGETLRIYRRGSSS